MAAESFLHVELNFAGRLIELGYRQGGTRWLWLTAQSLAPLARRGSRRFLFLCLGGCLKLFTPLF